jgi:hypothetical protein
VTTPRDPRDPWHPDQPRPDEVARWEADIERTRRRQGGMPVLPRVGDGITTQINFFESYSQLAAVAMARAAFYGELLQQQMDAEHGTGGGTRDGAVVGAGLVGFTYATNVVGPARDQEVELTATGEQARALVELEYRERREAARLIERAVAMDIDLRRADVIQSYAGTISAALQALVLELGMSLDDEPILRAAQRAALSARRMMGHDDGDPDTHIGARMSAAERVESLRAALAVAERAAASAAAAAPQLTIDAAPEAGPDVEPDGEPG